MACSEISEVDADAELLPKNSRKPSRFSPDWLIFSTSPMRTVTKNDWLSAITTSPWDAPLALALAKISCAKSWLSSYRFILSSELLRSYALSI